MDQHFFLTKIFSWTKFFLWEKTFFTRNFVLLKILFYQQFFDNKFFFTKTFLLTKKIIFNQNNFFKFLEESNWFDIKATQSCESFNLSIVKLRLLAHTCCCLWPTQCCPCHPWDCTSCRGSSACTGSWQDWCCTRSAHSPGSCYSTPCRYSWLEPTLWSPVQVPCSLQSSYRQ